MVTSVHQVDDGAWVSVDDSREVTASDLRLLACSGVCACESVDFLARGSWRCRSTTRLWRRASPVAASPAEGVTAWLELGRGDPETGTFRPVDATSVHVPEWRTRLATPA